MPGHVIAEGDEHAFDPPGGFRAWFIWFVAALFYLYEFNLRNMASIMEHALQQAFSADAAHIGSAIGAYDIAYAPMQIVVGLLMDRFGAKKLLTIACAVCAGGTFVFANADGLTMIAVGRFMMGVGSSFAFVGALYLATVWFPARQIALLAGFTTALGMVGAILNQPLSYVVKEYDWRVASTGLAWAGAGLTLIIFFLIPKPPEWIENTLKEQKEKSGSGLLFWARLRSVLSNPQVWLISLVAMTLYIPLSAFGELWGDEYIMSLCNTDMETAASIMSMVFIGWGIGGPIAGWVSDYTASRRVPLIIGSLLLFIIITVFISLPSAPVWLGMLLLILMGICASPQVICFAAAIEVSPRFSRGTAAAIVNMVVMIFESIFQPLVGKLLDMRAPDRPLEAGPAAVDASVVSQHFQTADFQFAFAWVPIVLFIGLILSLFVRESHASRRKPA